MTCMMLSIKIYIAPLPDQYSEALPKQAKRKRTVLRRWSYWEQVPFGRCLRSRLEVHSRLCCYVTWHVNITTCYTDPRVSISRLPLVVSEKNINKVPVTSFRKFKIHWPSIQSTDDLGHPVTLRSEIWITRLPWQLSADCVHTFPLVSPVRPFSSAESNSGTAPHTAPAVIKIRHRLCMAYNRTSILDRAR